MTSKSEFSKENRKPIAIALKHLLADTYALYLKTQNFHWNVTGPSFNMLHLFFEGQYEELAEAVDLIAERIRALGYQAPASFAEFMNLTQIKDADETKKTAEVMLKELLADHHTIISSMEKMMSVAEDCKDQGSLDLLIERTRAQEKNAWMLISSV